LLLLGQKVSLVMVVEFKKKAKKAKAGAARKRVHDEEPDDAQDDVGETLETIDEILQDQKLRAQLARSDVDAKPAKVAKKSTNAGTADAVGAYGLHDPKKDGSANKKLINLLDGQFTGQSGATEKDQHEELMNKYIEERLHGKKDKNSPTPPAAALEDNLYTLPEHMKVQSSEAQSEESAHGGVLMWNTGIAEVELPDSYAHKTIQATKAALTQSQRSAVAGVNSSALPTNYSTDFNRHRKDFISDLKNMNKVGKHEASDNVAVSRFRKAETQSAPKAGAKGPTMSWLWANDTTEQAQIVVSALQTELDEREEKIKALEQALRREQQDFQQMVQGEIHELETRKQTIEDELAEVNRLIQEKQKLLQKGKGTPKKKKKAAANGAANGAAKANNVAVAAAPTKTPSAPAAAAAREEKKAAVAPKAMAAAAAKPAAAEAPAKKALPVDPHVAKVATKEPNVAFIIQRSTNSNTVVYAGKVKGKTLDPSKPLDVFWFMYEKDGAPREELNMVERNSAYGASVAPVAGKANQYTVALSALKDREIVLLQDSEGRVEARTTIDGKPNVIVRRVFVQMSNGWVPSVEYVDIFGVHPQTLEQVYERKTK
ncbi:TPA: hypothetical protein N0F65_011806, partial [Lagenidium giganteum]